MQFPLLTCYLSPEIINYVYDLCYHWQGRIQANTTDTLAQSNNRPQLFIWSLVAA